MKGLTATGSEQQFYSLWASVSLSLKQELQQFLMSCCQAGREH